MFGLTINDLINTTITGLCMGFGSAIGTYLAVTRALKAYERHHKKIKRFFKQGRLRT